MLWNIRSAVDTAEAAAICFRMSWPLTNADAPRAGRGDYRLLSLDLLGSRPAIKNGPN
jgi:hypothetical protein